MDLIDAMNNLTCTENGEVAFKSSGNKNLDLFIKVVRSSTVSHIVEKFVEAYNEDPMLAIKVLYNFRDIRGGKGEKLISFIILFWLKYHQVEVYQQVLYKIIAEYGCWKDILFLCDLTNKYNETYNKNSNRNTRDCDYAIIDIPFDNEFELNMMKTQLEQDYKSFQNKLGFSLFPKWAPMENKKYHKIAKDLQKVLKMNPKEYRKTLVELKKKLNLVETNLSTNKEYLIDFEKIPSKCHKLHRNAFQRTTNAKDKVKETRVQLKERYDDYLKKLEKGEKTIKFKGIQPHELVKTYYKEYYNNDNKVDTVVESQWKALVKDIRDKGTFDRSIAVVDVSGSMSGEPMLVSIALGILTAECSRGKYANQMITFHEKPSIVKLTGETLMEKVRTTSKMDWGGSTNLESVFQMILDLSLQYKIPKENMIDKLFIFTDMQFDSIQGYNSRYSWNSTFGKLKDKYAKFGYDLPQIICWNLRASTSDSLPALNTEQNVCMLSGFSGELLKSVLDTPGQIDPMFIFRKMVDKYESPFVEIKRPIKNQLNLSGLGSVVDKCKIKTKAKGRKRNRR